MISSQNLACTQGQHNYVFEVVAETHSTTDNTMTRTVKIFACTRCGGMIVVDLAKLQKAAEQENG